MYYSALKLLTYFVLIIGITSIKNAYASYYPIKDLISKPQNVAYIIKNYTQKDNHLSIQIPNEYKTYQNITDNIIPMSKVLKIASISAKEFITISNNQDLLKIEETPANNLNNKTNINQISSSLVTPHTIAQTNIAPDKEKLNNIISDTLSIPSLAVNNSNSSISINVFKDEQKITNDPQSTSIQQRTTSNISLYRDQISEHNYIDVKLQVVDERSILEQNIIYPISYANIHIMSLNYHSNTDALGKITIKELPINSRFLVFVESPTLEFLPTVVEISTMLSQAEKVQYITVLRYNTFVVYQELAKTAQHIAKSSICARIITQEPQGYTVKIDVPSSKTFYFNRFNILDSTLTQTSENAKFCIFNIEPGPASINVFKDSELVFSLPVNFFASRHIQKDLDINQKISNFSCAIALHPTAPETLNNLDTHKDDYSIITDLKNIELSSIGIYQPLEIDNDSQILFKSSHPIITSAGKFFMAINAPEFEFTLYQLEEDAQTNKTLISIPRGFVQDMALYSNTIFDPQLGSLIIEHANFEEQQKEGVNIKVLTYDGKEVDNGWYFAEYPTTKAIYFNLEPNQYQIIVEDKNGNLISAQTVFIYNETLSLIQTGKILLYKWN